jgi:hypothetical protein
VFDTNRFYDVGVAFGVTGLRHELTLERRPRRRSRSAAARSARSAAGLELISRAPTIAASAAVVAGQNASIVQALVPSPLTLLAPGAPVTWSAMPAAVTEFGGGTWLRQRAALNGAPGGALSVQVEAPGAASATLRAQWAPTTDPTPADADWADLFDGGAPTAIAAVGAQTHPSPPSSPRRSSPTRPTARYWCASWAPGATGARAPWWAA